MNAKRKTQNSKLEILLILILALIPRTVQLNDFYTIDEGYHWPGRVERFSEALINHDWAATNQTGHPGVTTMWLGSLGRQLAFASGISDPGWAGGGAAYLAMLRLALACVNALAVVLGFVLLRRLLPRDVALLSVILWATSPFLIAHGRILHLDALLTSFMTLSILALLVRGQGAGVRDRGSGIGGRGSRRGVAPKHPPLSDMMYQKRHWNASAWIGSHETRDRRQQAANRRPQTAGSRPADRRQQTTDSRRETLPETQNSKLKTQNFSASSLVLSAFFAGLALITKAPSLILLPFIGLLIFFQQFTTSVQPQDVAAQHNSSIQPQDIAAQRNSIFRSTLLLYLAWLGLALLTAGLLWPAIWVDPAGSVGSVIREIIDNGGQPHHSGNYFLGQPVGDPGLWFYPAVVLLRSTPLSLVGLLTALGYVGWQLISRQGDRIPITIITLLIFCVLFGLLMSVEAKKLDRYLLPIWPGLEILAAYGLCKLWQAFQRGIQRSGFQKLFSLHSALLLGIVVLIQVWQLMSIAPYYMAYYNPMLGGGPAAERVMLVGLGEGLEQVGAWLRERPDLQRGDVLSWIPPSLAPFVPRQVLVRDLRTEYLDQVSSYAVLYVRSVQHKENAIAEARVRENPALYTLQINGITYATVHQLPRPFDTPINAQFGNDLALLGFSQQQLGSTLVITPSWSILQDRPAGLTAFVHVLDQRGQTIARVDAVLDQGMFPAWQAGQKFDSPLPLMLPSDQPASSYQIVLGVYEPNGPRLPVTRGVALPEDIDGPQVIELMSRKP